MVPAWGYRLTQGIHVTTGIASIPLVLIKLWSVYPNSFRWPPFPSAKRLLERLSVAVLVSATLVQLVTGFLNLLDWRPFGWDFVVVHYALAYVVIGSVLLHVAIKLPDIRYGLTTRLAAGDVLTEIPWHENPVSHSNAGPQPPPVTPGISRRGVLLATGAGIGLVVITSVGQTLTPLEPLGLLAVRQPSKGPQGVPVGRTAEEAGVVAAATDPDWQLEVKGPRPYALRPGRPRTPGHPGRTAADRRRSGLERQADWRGIRLLDLVERAGGTAGSRVVVRSLGKGGITKAELSGSQLERAMLATELNGSGSISITATRCDWSDPTGPSCSTPSGSARSRCSDEGAADRAGGGRRVAARVRGRAAAARTAAADPAGARGVAARRPAAPPRGAPARRPRRRGGRCARYPTGPAGLCRPR